MLTEWNDILKQRGNANIGATLIRLARQAQAMHQYEVAQALAHGGTGPPLPELPAPPVVSDAMGESIAMPKVRLNKPAHMEVSP